MKLKSALSALTLALASTYAVADPPDFHGYFRAGAGQNSKGGEMTCFGLPGAQAKYRLGNECDNYGEFLFSADVFKGKDGALWRGHAMFTTTNAGFPGGGDNGTNAGFNQMYVSGQDITPGLKGATLWAGKRFYDRVQSDANDHFLVMGDGTGAGLEGIDVGAGRLGFDYIRRQSDTDRLVTAEFGAKLVDIPVNPDGKLGFYGYYLKDSKNDFIDSGLPPGSPGTRSAKGYRFNVTHNQGNLLGGDNLAVLTFAKGGLPGGVTGNYDPKQNSFDVRGFDDDKAWRVADSLFIAFPAAMFDARFTFEYQKTTTATARRDAGLGNDQKEWSFGARPMFHFTDIMAVALDFGHNEVKVDGDSGGKRKLDKISVILSASAGPNMYSRPTVRLFYTYAKWNEAAQNAGIVGQSSCNTATPDNGGSVFGCAKNGSNIGVQGEVWF